MVGLRRRNLAIFITLYETELASAVVSRTADQHGSGLADLASQTMSICRPATPRHEVNHLPECSGLLEKRNNISSTFRGN